MTSPVTEGNLKKHFRAIVAFVPLLFLLLLTSCNHPPGTEEQAQTTAIAPDSLVVQEAVPVDSISSPAGAEAAEPDSSWFEPSIMGTGIISIADDADPLETQFRFYDRQGKPVAYISVNEKVTSTVIRGREYRDIDSTHPWAPRFFDPEPHYFQIYFDVLGTTDGTYKVLLNRKTGLTGYIKRDDRNFRFRTVEDFVQERAKAGIEFHISRNPLRQQPVDNAAVVPVRSSNKFSWASAEKISMRGDWMQVRLESGETGWIRWRKGNDILIGLIYRC